MRFPHFALGLCLIFGALGTVRAADLTPSSVWMTDFAKAQAEARRLHRPLVVHFGGRTCPPCRQMEADILNSQSVLKQLNEGFVAVKVDLDDRTNERLQSQFAIVGMPTDVILGHDGSQLYRSQGYTRGSAADRTNYMTALSKVDTAYLKRLSRHEPAEEIAKTGPQMHPTTKPATLVDEGSKAVGSKLVPEPVEPHRIEVADDAAKADPFLPTAPKSDSFVAALDGYCPVTLRTTRTWKKGDRQFSVVHEGQTFVFISAEKRSEFAANPSRFAPRALGCDPVVLSESRLAIRGSTKFGAFYEGELFLFETAETRVKFRNDPARYHRIQQALRLDDIQEARKTAGTVSK